MDVAVELSHNSLYGTLEGRDPDPAFCKTFY